MSDLANFVAGFRSVGHVTYVSIVPDGPTTARTFNGADREQALAWIEIQNGEHRNVYFTTNPPADSRLERKPKKDDIGQLAAVWADIDPRDGQGLEWEIERERLGLLAEELMALETPPSLIIDSGNGIQAIWMAEEPVENSAQSRNSVEGLCRRIEHALGAQGTHNCDRLLRVPGTVNYPNARKRELGRGKSRDRLLHGTWQRHSWRALEELARQLEIEPPRHAAPVLPRQEVWLGHQTGTGRYQPLEVATIEALLKGDHRFAEHWRLRSGPEPKSAFSGWIMRLAAYANATWPDWSEGKLGGLLTAFCIEHGRRDKLARDVPRAVETIRTHTDASDIGRLKLTDIGNAHRLAAMGQGEILFARGLGWMHWTGTHWVEGDAGVIKLAKRVPARILRDAAERAEAGDAGAAGALMAWAKKSAKAERIRAMITLARPDLEIETRDLDADPWLLTVLNGTLDLRTRELMEHKPEDLITKVAPVEYREGAPSPQWDEFLHQILPSEPVRDYVQRLAGYCLTGDTSEQCLFFLQGDGANGKSVLVTVLRRILGPYAVMVPQELLTAAEAERHPTEVMTVRGARLAIASELEKGRRWAAERIKLLTGEEEITSRKMRQDFVTFRVSAKLLVMANHKPAAPDHGHAFWRRMRLIVFTITIPEAERENFGHLCDRLAAEGSGILQWALDGLAKWHAGGLGTPAEIAEAVEGYRCDTDNVSRFLAECCDRDPATGVRPGELYAVYRRWCATWGQQAGHERDFKARLMDLGIERYTINGYAYWIGIGLPHGDRDEHDGTNP